MIQVSKVVAALSTSIRTSWKVAIHNINGALLILNLAPLYNKAVAKSEGNETARQVLAEQFRTLEQVSRVDGEAARRRMANGVPLYILRQTLDICICIY